MITPGTHPRLVIAGTAGDGGKTLFTLGLILALRDLGLEVRAFKKGPDYIDAAWLSWASGHAARNLDTYLMGFDTCAASFASSSLRAGINLIEGNRGLYDGSDAKGTHSTAELAKKLNAPVLLLINATKVTRTLAAYVLGCQKFDPELDIAGVVVNHVSSERHASVVCDAVQSECNIRVMGCLRRLPGEALLPSRHLGLVTPYEHPRVGELADNLRKLINGQVDLDAVLALAQGCAPLEHGQNLCIRAPDARGVRIGLLRDSALSFYYPENLEELERSGATLLPVSPLTAGDLPAGLHALYIGGGFPETHGASLSANQSFLSSLRSAAGDGLPIYAECGGLMLLSRAIRWQNRRFPMAGVFPIEVEVCPQPQGHGYVELLVDRPNPFFQEGTILRGHEFHYSRVLTDEMTPATACRVQRGTGCGGGRDALVQHNVWASYTHLHALGAAQWAPGLLAAAMRFSSGGPRPHFF